MKVISVSLGDRARIAAAKWSYLSILDDEVSGRENKGNQ